MVSNNPFHPEYDPPEQPETIVVTGNPVDGLSFYGPFLNTEEAALWAENERVGPDWWVTTLKEPT